jgi:hypothetical protein
MGQAPRDVENSAKLLLDVRRAKPNALVPQSQNDATIAARGA